MKIIAPPVKRVKGKVVVKRGKTVMVPTPAAVHPLPKEIPGDIDVISPESYDTYVNYLAPSEMVDDPDYWNNEFSYFGLVSQSAGDAVTKPSAPWYANLMTMYMSYRQQRDFQKEQARRRAAGQPPLDIDVYRQSLPAAQVQVGMSPQIRNMLIYGGLGLAAIILLPTLLRRR